MDNSEAAKRSFEKITTDDLRRLAELALDDLRKFFARREETAAIYRDRLLALCLCQGAAEHYVTGKHGVKDFDVWAFFPADPARPFPPRRIGHADFGPSKFDRHPADVGYRGRRVDIIGRSIEIERGEDAIIAIRRYMEQARTRSARLLSSRPAVVIHPLRHIGKMVAACDP